MTSEFSNFKKTNTQEQMSNSRTQKPENKNIPHKSHKKILIEIVILLILLGIGAGSLFGWIINSTQKPTIANNQDMSENTKKEKLRIGMIVPLTGDGASYGINAREIAQLVEAEINTNNGIANRQVQFIFEDGQCNSEAAKIAAEKLIYKDKVEFLYGGECSDEMLGSVPIAQANKIITVSSGATSPKISSLGKYIFRTAPSDALGGKIAAQYAYSQLKSKKAALLYENSEYATQLGEVFKNEFQSYGGEIVFQKQYKSGETNFDISAVEIKQVQPDIIYIVPQTPIPGILAIKTLRENNVQTQILTAEVLLSRDEITKNGKILEGIIGMEAYFDNTTKRYTQLNKKFIEKFGHDIAYPTDLGDIFDLITLYKEAYEQSNPPDADQIAIYLHNLQEWNGVANQVTFDHNGDIVSKPYGIYKITNNTVQLVTTLKAL